MLHIKNDYYIKAGAKSYILMKKLSKKEKPEVIDAEDEIESISGYKNIGYYSKIEAAMEEMVRDQINNNADTELKEIVDYITKLRKEMDDLLTEKVQGL